MLCTRTFVFVALVVLVVALPAWGNGGPSLRGVLRALERRRHAPPGAIYPLSSFQYPERAMEYLARNEYQTDDSPVLLDPNDREKMLEKGILMNYLDKDEDYPSDDLDLNYKGTAFRERVGELKARRKKIMEKKRSTAFRERAGKHNLQDERLKEIFLKELAEEEAREQEESQLESDAEYVELLKELWDKYKYSHPESVGREPPEEIFKKSVRKRQIPGEYSPSAWGPIAFKKKKRSPNQRLDEADTPNDFLYSLKFTAQNDPSVVESLKDEKVNDDDDDPDISKILYEKDPDPRYSSIDPDVPNPSDIRDEYIMLNLQPSNSLQTNNDDPNEYLYDNEKEKRFPVTKRSGPNIDLNRRDLVKRNSHLNKKKTLRSSGTDPKVLKELSNLFNGFNAESSETFSKPVKRSSSPEETSHEIKAPTAGLLTNHANDNQTHNHTHDHQHSDGDHSHDHEHDHPHSRHEHENKPPLLSGPGETSDHSHEHEDAKNIDFKDGGKSHLNMEHPIILKKKSIDWSNYFGMDKRRKKSYYGNPDLESLRNLYLGNAKRNLNYGPFGGNHLLNHPPEEPINLENDDFEMKRKTKQAEQLKLENMDNKIKNMETAMVDEAIQYSEPDEEIDSKEEQEIKEKILSRLAAAYSLEKMRKALKEFKMSLQTQVGAIRNKQHSVENEEEKEKRTTMDDDKKKKKKSEGPDSDEDLKSTTGSNGFHTKDEMDFEGEQGAGHFLNGPEPMSEGYMGGSGMKIKPNHYEGNENSQCPVLDRIVRRCHSIDILAGDHGQLFLPLCSLHQICYLCGPSSPTACDLIFISEADSVCGGRTACQQAARAALMALREDHDSLADDLEGECERGSCLYQAVENNADWQHPLKR